MQYEIGYNAAINIDPILPGEGMTDVPIYCLCKGTAKGKHYTLFFAGDGYTAEEQESFVKDAREKMKLFLKPFSIQPVQVRDKNQASSRK